MKRYLPIILSLVVIVGIGSFVFVKKQESIHSISTKNNADIGTFTKLPTCAKAPIFLNRINIPQPVIIDLSQKIYKGIAFYYGKDFSKVLHPKIWEQYGHYSTYTIDAQGNIFLVPTPYISIHPTTFNLQKNIYKLDTKTGKISIFVHFDDVSPSAQNPYGINAITYDCDNKALWVAAIDKSNYQSEKGRIYAIDKKHKEISFQINGIDALSLQTIKTNQRKFLLVGSARDNGLYAYDITMHKKTYKRMKLLELPSSTERIRKIKIKADNTLELQSIPFSYTLIAQSAEKDRTFYIAKWDETTHAWIVKRK